MLLQIFCDYIGVTSKTSIILSSLTSIFEEYYKPYRIYCEFMELFDLYEQGLFGKIEIMKRSLFFQFPK